MKNVCGALVLWGLAVNIQAAEVVREISLASLKAEGALLEGEVRVSNGSPAFEYVALSNAGPDRTVALLRLEHPGLTIRRYALVGEVRHEGGAVAGNLEMWSTYAQSGSWCTRAVADEGPMGRLRGSSSWHPFVLLFDGVAKGAPAVPQTLVLNVILYGRATVDLAHLRLVQYGENESPLLGLRLAAPDFDA